MASGNKSADQSERKGQKDDVACDNKTCHFNKLYIK